MIARGSWNIRKFFTPNGRSRATTRPAPIARRRQASTESPPNASTTAAGMRAAARLASMTLHPAHDGSAEQPARLHQQDRDDENERDGELQLAPKVRDERAGEVLDHADRKATDHGAAGTGQAADHRGRKPVEQDAEHHIG